MRKLILKMSVSMDGFVAGPNGESAWIFKTGDAGSAAWVLETVKNAGLHMMGSRTFHDMKNYWPTSDEPFAAPMNEIPKVVFSHKGKIEAPTAGQKAKDQETVSQQRAEAGAKAAPRSPYAHTWDEAEVASGDISEEVARLKAQPGKDIVAYGGASFAQSLIERDLVDEYQLMVHPVILGQGMPIFTKRKAPLYLKLVETVPFEKGVVAHVYRREG